MAKLNPVDSQLLPLLWSIGTTTRTHYQLQVIEVWSSTKYWKQASYTVGDGELYILCILPLWASLVVVSHLATGNVLHGHLVPTELRVWAQLLPITVRLWPFPESK